jgi:hypothetical protein
MFWIGGDIDAFIGGDFGGDGNSSCLTGPAAGKHSTWRVNTGVVSRSLY